MRSRGACVVQCSARAAAMKIAVLTCLLALVAVTYVSYELYWKPWGEQQLEQTAPSSHHADATACADCTGVNRAFPVDASTTSSLSPLGAQLANHGGCLVSALVCTGVVLGIATALVSLIHTLSTLSRTASSTSTSIASDHTLSTASSSTDSSSSIQFDALLLVLHGQFITLLGSLQLRGTPVFFLQFCSRLAWTNLHMLFPHDDTLPSVATQPTAAGATDAHAATASEDEASRGAVHGVQQYAQLIGVSPDDLFRYTCIAVIITYAVAVGLYAIARSCVRRFKSDHLALITYLDARAIQTAIMLLSVLQYPLAMTSTYELYDALSTSHVHHARSQHSPATLVLAFVVLLGACVGFVGAGVRHAALHTNRCERDDANERGGTVDVVDTETLERQAVDPSTRLGASFNAEYTTTNTFFFVVTLGRDIVSGIVVSGIMQEPMTQLSVLVALHVLYIMLLVLREPYAKRQRNYASVATGSVRVIVLLLFVVQTTSTTFPQRVRDIAAVTAIGLYVVLFACLAVHQVVVAVGPLLRASCRATGMLHSFASSSPYSSSSSAAATVAFAHKRTTSDGASAMWSPRQQQQSTKSAEPRLTLQERIASKIRGDTSSPTAAATTPSMHSVSSSPSPSVRSSESYKGNESHRFV